MSKESLPPLKFGQGLCQYETDYPIIQGGMSVGISGAELAAEVANCGGAGTIGGVGLGFTRERYTYEAGRQALIRELKKAREISPYGIIGVNVLEAVYDYKNLVRFAAKNGASFIASGAGLPLDLPELTKDHPEVALLPILSSVQGVRVLCKRWKKQHDRLPDAIIIEAPSTAGGHLGVTSKQGVYDEDLKLEYVIPKARNFLESQGWDIPLIAAGGIWTREDIDRVLKLGASGVQMATRFVCTPECSAPIEFKEEYLGCEAEDIEIIISPVGYPGRAITKNSDLLKRVKKGENNDRCIAHCLTSCTLQKNRRDPFSYCIIKALNNTLEGNIGEGVVFSGSNAWRAKEQGKVPVRQVFEELTR